MTGLIITVGVLCSYLLGSVPTSIWYGRWSRGIDIRDHGSGNAGATNTFRVLGVKAGSIVMLIDVSKGFAATWSPWIIQNYFVELSLNEYVFTQIGFGFAAVLGHIFPLYERFKGGKGVATLLGMVLSINLYAALICLGVFLIVFLISRIVALGSMIAALIFATLQFIPALNSNTTNPILIGYGIVIFILVLFTHKKNIKRMINKEENKANLKSKKSRS